MITFKYLLLGLTYLGFGWGYLPWLRMNRAAIAIVGSAFAVALGSRRPQNCLAGDRHLSVNDIARGIPAPVS
ncbi:MULTISPECIES: hypothetical protein [unclassified Microcoleus]|uniref:hypothetical protein n=1 Tax=unclassified Microcoleus TaxID=2642155 RepID=UPI0025E07836|nr:MULTISPECIES: hypothetical protein [unclassified Microcoleus]